MTGSWRLGNDRLRERAQKMVKSLRVSGVGIKMEGLLYCPIYGTGGPEYGIKEESVMLHEQGRLVVYSPLTGANWKHLLVSGRTGKENAALHNRTRTQHHMNH